MSLGQKQAAWALDVDGALYHINTADCVRISPNGFASLLSCGPDGVLWVLPTDSTNELAFSVDHGVHWERVKLPVENIRQLSGTPWGSCLLVTTHDAALLLEKDGASGIVFPEGQVDRVSCSPDGYLWSISKESKSGGGHLIKCCHHTHLFLQPLAGLPTGIAIAAGSDGGASAVTVGREILSIPMHQMAGLETKGGEAFAQDISIGSDGTIWVLSVDDLEEQDGHYVRYWHPKMDKYLAWRTVPDLRATAIAGVW